jgi:hypothetical protein
MKQYMPFAFKSDGTFFLNQLAQNKFAINEAMAYINTLLHYPQVINNFANARSQLLADLYKE